MKLWPQRVITLAVALWAVTAYAPAYADAKNSSMADSKVVLQISDNDPSKQELVLNVANNLIEQYGQDQIAIEIVAFGPGMRLLFANNENKGRIQGLTTKNVRFSACKNTITAMTKQLGYEPELHAKAERVDAGAGRIMELVKEGYVLIKP